MSTKQLSLRDIATPPVSAAIAILEFGRLIQEEDQRRIAARKPSQLQEAEEQLIARLSTDKNTLLKPVLNFNVSKPIEPITLRVLAVVAYLQLCTAKFGGAISDVARVVADGIPATIIEARQTISKLLIAKQLQFRENSTDHIELGAAMMDLLAGGKEAPPLTITEKELWRRWRKAEALEAKRKAKAGIENLPTAKQLATKLAESVIGLDEQVRTFACRVALHQRRAVLIRAGNDPGSPRRTKLKTRPAHIARTRSMGICSSKVRVGKLREASGQLDAATYCTSMTR
jgi:hypothetical protein